MALPPPQTLMAEPEKRTVADAEPTATCVTATHEVLFEILEATRCDACGGGLQDDRDDGAGSGGRGTYMWLRGDSVEVENVPLCASCAAAIGITALSRWEIEEEEG